MFDALKSLFGRGPKTDIAGLLAQGAVVIDVRSRAGFEGGHVKGSINIPLNELQNNLGKLNDKQQAIITCCASGIRSASAKKFLKGQGYSHVHNGGSWAKVSAYCK